MNLKEIEYARQQREKCRGIAFPRRVTMQITNLCNSRCKMCNVWQAYRTDNKRQLQDELSRDELLHIADRLIQAGTKHIDITGGEPFLKDGIVDLLTLIMRRLGFVVVITNALNAGAYLEKVRATAADAGKVASFIIYVSLDGNKKSHDSVRGVEDSYDQAMEMLEGLKELRTQYPNISTGVSYTIHKENLYDMSGTLEYLLENRIIDHADQFAFRPAQKNNFFSNESIRNIDEEIIREVESVQNKFHFQENNGFIEGFKENMRNPRKMLLPCQALFVSCLIDPYGGVVPCITMTDKIIDNLRNTSYDLLPIWESGKASDYRKEIKNGNCAVCWTDCQAFENLLYQKGDFMDQVSFDGIIKKIKTILAKNSGVENMNVGHIKNDAKVFGLGGVITDSLNILDALTEIESEFAFEIPDEDLTEELFVSIDALAKYVCKNGVLGGT